MTLAIGKSSLKQDNHQPQHKGSQMKAPIRVMTHAYGPATLRREYMHRESKEIVWDIKADTGEIFHASQQYAAGLERIKTVKAA